MKRTSPPASGAARLLRARRPVIEEVEPRILYSADFSPGLLDEPIPYEQPEQRFLDGSGEYISTESSESVVLPDVGSGESGDYVQPGTSWELEQLLAEDPALAVDGDQPTVPGAAGDAPASAQVELAVGSTPLAFERNQGQTDAQVDFLARGSGYAVWLTDGDAVIALRGEDSGHVLRLDVLGADPDAVATGEGLLGGTSNYLIGAQAQWQSDLANYQGVYYDEIYDGIDLRYYGNERQLEYDFILAPGAEVGDIRLALDGIQGATIAESGELVLDLGDGQVVVFKAPVSWQDGTAGREAVASRYLLREDGSIGFEVGAYDRARALTIDPVFSYGTYLGGSSGDQVLGMTADSAGNVYVTGFSQSANFPTTAGAYRTADLTGEDVFVTKFTPNLSGFVYSTYLGGNDNDEEGYNIAVDSAGNAYVTGYTKSTDFPVVSAYQSTLDGGWDAFVAKLNPAGNALVYSTYLGGSGNADTGYSIAVDATGNAYVAGYATAAGFPTTAGAADTTYVQGEGFVTKLSAAGNSLLYSTYFGGSNFDAAYAIAVDAGGNAVIVGETNSTDLPVTGNAFQTSLDGGSDILVAKLNAAGSAFTYATYLGGGGDDQGLGVTFGPGGKIYLTGSTRSSDFDVTAGALQPNDSGAGDAIVSVLDPSLSGVASLVYSTYLGGSKNNEDAWNISVDGGGRIYVAGSTDSDDFPTTAGAYSTTRAGGDDVFVVQINPAGGGASDLLYGSYWGGSNTESALTGVYANGTFYFAGATDSNSSIATAGTVDTTYNGGTDGFVAAFSFDTPPVVTVNPTPLSYTENAGTQLLDTTLTVSDVDSPNLTGATLQFTANYVLGEDSLAFVNAFGITGTWSAAAGMLTLTGTSSVGNYEMALRSITYANASQSPSTLTRSIRILASDGSTTSAAVVRQVNVTSVNDVPAISAPASQAMNEDATLIFSSGVGNAIAVSDLDAGTSPVRLTLTGTSGTLTLFQTSGLTFTTGDGVGDASMTFTGTISNINAALNGLRFNPNLHYNGGASVQVSINDLGNTGTPGAQIANRSVAITVAAVNDAPVGTNKNGLGWHATGAEFLVNTTTANNQTEAAVAMDANGNFVVVYSADGGQDGDKKGIYAQRYDAAGVAQGAQFRVNTTTADDQQAASVAMDSNGNFVVTWMSRIQDPDGSEGVYAQRYSAAGVAQGAEFRVNVTTTLSQNQSVVAMDANGNFTVAWKDASSGGNTDVYARRYDAAGTALSSEFRVNTDTTNAQDKATIGMNGSGAFVIAWKSTNPLDGSGTGVFAQRYDSAGVAQGGEFQVNTYSSGNQDKPSAAMAADGSFVIAWVSGNNQDGDRNGVFAQRFDASGVKQGGEFQVNTYTVDNQDVPTIAIDGSGRFTIAWTSNLQDGANKGIYARSYAADGSAIFDEVRVNTTTTGTQDQPSIAMRPNGDFVAVWNGNGPGDTAGVFGQRYLGITTVTALEDTDYVFTASDFGFTDPSDSPVNALSNVKITTLPGAGSLKLAGVPVTAGQFVSVANINAGNLKFTPVANASGAGYASFTFQVQDDGGTAAGGVDLDPTPNTISIDVTAVNEAPVGTNRTVTTLEDTIYTFTAADFGFTDPSDSPGNALLNVKITTIPGAGGLELSGVAVTAGQFVSVASITAGDLTFTPVANASGAGYASFTFQVQDDGGTANSGVDLDTVARTMTLNVTSVNDAPIGTNNTVTTLEDAVYTFTAADFGFTDPSDAAGAGGANALLNVKITTIPGAGALELSGVAVTAGQFVSVASITAGNLKFTPVANANGAGYASFTFQVQDDGGTANSGVDLDTVARTMTLNVTSVNDAPIGTNKTVTTLEDSVYTFTAADFGFTDPSDASGAGGADTLLNVRITTIPGAGALELSGVAVTAGQFVSVANITAGNLTFTPVANASGAGYASFTFQVQDDGGTANAGVDLDTAARTMTVNVSSVNDAPIGTNNTVTTLEDSVYTFTAADFGFTDPTDSPVNVLLNVKITTIPGAGALELSGVAVTAGQFVSVANITAGNLTFTPVANASGAGYASFTFQAQDDGGTANSGVDLDTAARTMTLNVTSVNDAPIGTNKTVTTLEDAVYTFTAADFGFTDPSDSPGNALLNVKITTIPGAGALELSGVAVTAGQFVSVANITAGNLTFTPVANANGAGYASFTFQAQDDGGTANSGVDLDTVARTMTLNVTSVNDAPIGTNKTVTTFEDAVYTFTVADFGFADPSDAAGAGGANTLLNVRITTLPGAGALELSGVAVTAGQFVSVATITAGNLTFTPVANANGAGYASFTFQAQDDGGTANAGVDLDTAARTMTVNVSSVNDAPIGTNNTVTTLEDTVYTFTVADFGFADPSDAAGAGGANTLLNVRITTLPGAGALELSGVAVTAGQFVSVANITAGNLTFTPVANASGAGYASFTFQAQDDGGTANAGVDLDTAARTMTVNVSSVNDAPIGTNNTVTTLEDSVYAFTAADFGFTDPSDAAGAGGANALLNVKITTIPGAGALELSGVAVTAGQFVSVANITAGNLTFTPMANASGAGYASFTFQVQDDGGTANSGVDLDTSARTMSLNVISVNDAPVGTNNTVTTLEDTVYTFTAVDFGFTDPADSPVNALLNVEITTIPGAGALELSGVAVTAGQFVSVANITAGNLKFTPVANANGAGYASFTFQVQDDGGTANSGVDLDTAARTMTVNVTSVNDAPSNTVPGAQGTAHNTPLVFSAGNGNAITVADADAGAGLLQVTLSATNGSVLVGPVVGAASITGDGTATVTITGSAGDVNSALSGMSFTPALGYSGAGSLQIVTNDQGNTGAGGPLSDSDTVAITVANNVPASVSMTASTLSYAENDSATPVDANLTVGDPDSALLDHAHMTITSGYVNGEDLLEYVFNPLLPAITATWNAAAGELTLWGAASPAEYQQALRTVTYRNLSEQPSSAPRTITVEVEDGVGVDAGSFATRALSVNAVNDAPVIGVPAAQTATEDTALVFSTGNGNAISIADADAASASMRVSLTAANGVLTLSGTTGLTFNAGANGSASLTFTGTRTNLNNALNGLRFDPAADYNGPASVSVSVDDLGNTGAGGALTDSETIDINVLGANDPPAITSDGGGAAASRSVTENGTFVTDVDGADFDLPAQTLSYSIAGGTDAARFTIDALSGVLSFLTGPDREAPADTDLDSVYEVSVRVSDGNGGLDLQTLMVTVLDADEFDVGTLSDSNAAANSVAEDAAIGTLVGVTAYAADADATTNAIAYTLDDSAGGRFAIEGATGVVSLAGALDAETATSHSIIVRAVSADGSFRTQAFSIAVSDVNDWSLGPVTDSDAAVQSVIENAVPGTVVGYTALAIDPDVTNNSVTYTLDNDAGGRFAINVLTGVVTTSAALDYEAAVSHSIIVRATSSDGSTGAALVSIAVGDANDAPVVGNQSFAVDENSAPGTLVATLVTADPDAGDVLTYSIVSGNSAGAFAIDAAGQISVANSVALDFETVPVFVLGVTVLDAGGLSASATVTINLNNLNDPPLALDDAAATSEDAALIVTPALGVLANDSDPEGGTLTVTAVEGNPADVGSTITLASGALLRLNADGSFDYDPNGAFDWMAAGDIDFDTFSYEMSDAGGASSSATLTVTLTGVNDAPLGFDSVVTPDEDTPYVFSSADFGFADPDSSLEAVTIVTLPGSGSLTLAGVPLAAGTLVSAAQISAGDLVFTPALDQNGAGYASFQVRVSDGVVSAAGTSGVTIDVAAVNDLPLVTTNAVTGMEDTALNLTTAYFTGVFSDVDGDSLALVEIVALPDNGSLLLSGAPVAVNDVVPLAQLGNLVFMPSADWSGSTLFAWLGHDGTGFSAAAAGMTLTLAPINDAPLLSAGAAGGSVLWGGTLTLAPGVLQVADVDNLPAQLVFTITALPGGGTLYRGGVALGANGTFTQNDIDAGLVQYVNAGGAFATDAFAFTVADGAGGVLGATTFDIAVGAPPPVPPVVMPPPPPPPPPVSGGGSTPPASGDGSSGSTTGPSDSSEEAPVGDALVGQTLEAALLGAPAPTLNNGGAATRNAVDARAQRVNFGQVLVERSAVGYTIYTSTLGPSAAPTGGAFESLSVSGTLLSGPAAERAVLMTSIDSVTRNLSDSAFVGELDSMRDQLDGKSEVRGQLVASSVAVTGGLSVGYVIWLLRGGLLLSSLLSSLPAWHAVDPMPVLARGGSEDDDEGADEDPLERLFGKAKDRLLGGWRGKGAAAEAPPEAAEVANHLVDAAKDATVEVTA